MPTNDACRGINDKARTTKATYACDKAAQSTARICTCTRACEYTHAYMHARTYINPDHDDLSRVRSQSASLSEEDSQQHLLRTRTHNSIYVHLHTDSVRRMQLIAKYRTSRQNCTHARSYHLFCTDSARHTMLGTRQEASRQYYTHARTMYICFCTKSDRHTI